MLAQLSVFLGKLNPSLGELWGIQLYIFILVISLTGLFILGYLLQGTRVGVGLWMAVRNIRRLARTDRGVAPSAVAAVLTAQPYDHLWEEYSDTLHEVSRTSDGRALPAEVRATVPAEMFFTRDALVDGRLFDDFTRHLPGVLTGLGIIGTFAGLLEGLGKFDATSSTTAVAGLKALLDGVAHAFTTSAIAIGCAMFIVFISKFALALFYQQVESLNHSIDTLYATGAGEEYLSRLVHSSERATTNAVVLKQELIDDISRLLSALSDRQMAANAHNTEMLGRLVAEALQSSREQTRPSIAFHGTPVGRSVAIFDAEAAAQLEGPLARLHLGSLQVASAAQEIQLLLARLQES